MRQSRYCVYAGRCPQLDETDETESYHINFTTIFHFV